MLLPWFGGIQQDEDATAWPFEVSLDRKLCLIGVYSDPNTTWTLPFTDATIDTIVLSDDFGETDIIIPADSNDGTNVVAAGDYSAGVAMLGRLFAFSIELTRPFRRRFDGSAELDVWTTINRIAAGYRSSGPLSIRVAYPDRPDLTFAIPTQSENALSSAAIALLTGWVQGNAELMRIFLESTTAKTVVIPSVDIYCHHQPNRGRR